MARLFVYRVKERWFGQLTETRHPEGGAYQAVTNLVVPQSEPEIEAFARRHGYEIEWDSDLQYRASRARTRTVGSPPRRLHRAGEAPRSDDTARDL